MLTTNAFRARRSVMLSRIAAASSRNVRRAHTMSNDAYTKSPESFQKVLDTFKKYRACAVLRTPKEEQCAPAMQAAIDGGFEIVEVRACRRADGANGGRNCAPK